MELELNRGRQVCLLLFFAIIMFVIAMGSFFFVRFLFNYLYINRSNITDGAYEVALLDIDRNLVFGDIDTGKTQSLDIKVYSPDWSVKWSPNGQWLSTVSTDNKLWIVNDTHTAKSQILPSPETDKISGMEWSPTSSSLAFLPYSHSRSLGIWLYHMESGSYDVVLGTESYNCEENLAWSYDENWIICSTNTGKVLSIKIDGSQVQEIFNNANYPPWRVTTSPNSNYVVFQVYDNAWELYVADFTLPHAAMKIPKDYKSSIIFDGWSSGGMSVYASPYNNSGRLYEIDINSAEKVLISDDWGGAVLSPSRNKMNHFDVKEGVRELDLTSGRISYFEMGDLQNILKEESGDDCGTYWDKEYHVTDVLLCTYHRNLQTREVSVIHKSGRRTRIGNGLFDPHSFVYVKPTFRP